MAITDIFKSKAQQEEEVYNADLYAEKAMLEAEIERINMELKKKRLHQAVPE